MNKRKTIATININLDSLVGKLNVRLQHLSDIMKFANISLEKVDKNHYDEYKVFVSLNVAYNQSLSYENAKNEFHSWCLRNSFRDSVETLSGFLEECYVVCSLLKARKNECIKTEEYNKIIIKNSGKFHSMNFPDKIDILRKEFSVYSSLEEHVLSLNKVRNCLVHRDGIVSTKDLNTENELVAKFREIQLVVLSPDKTKEQIITEPTTIDEGGHLGIKVQNFERRFKLRERIDFEPIEHARTIFTFFAFGIEIYKSIAKFAGVEVKGGDSVNFGFEGIEINKQTREKEKNKSSEIR